MGRKQYIQNLIEQEKDVNELLTDLLCHQKGHVYVCGQASMANEVQIQLENLNSGNGQQIFSENRHHMDVFYPTVVRQEATAQP